MIGTSECCACRRVFCYAPSLVPSIPIDGEKRPVCRDCLAAWNKIHRTSKGLAPFVAPEGAYEGEPV
jgi:hypothetical protein